MVAAGEASGHLDGVLNRLADYTEQRQQLRARLLQAMIYPISADPGGGQRIVDSAFNRWCRRLSISLSTLSRRCRFPPAC